MRARAADKNPSAVFDQIKDPEPQLSNPDSDE